jgi:small subunit ribosomal protein S18
MARDRRSNSKGASADRRRPQKKKVSILNTESVTYIDYKDVNLLRRFMSERAKIRARRVTGNSTQQQREVARAIRVAREMALLPYSVRQVTQRKGGRRERGDRDDRELREMPVPPTGTGFDRSGGFEREEILDELVLAVDETGEPVAVAEVVVDVVVDDAAGDDLETGEEEA